LEEFSPLISNFLKKFKLTYGDQFAQNAKSFVSNTKDNEKSSSKVHNKLPRQNNTGYSLQDVHSAPLKLGVPAILEFMLDCLCAQWQSIVRCGRESILETMLKQVNKKKYSQKTNDFRTKSLLDTLMSAAGTEIPEFILLCNLVGILPKATSRICPGILLLLLLYSQLDLH
jgi:hypothetical protein